MRFSRATWPVLGAACLLLGAASACGSTSGSNVNGNGSGPDGTGAKGSGRAGSSDATGPILGLSGGEPATNNSGGGSAVGDCAGNLIEAQRIPLDIYVMLDVSGSMLQETADAMTTKWQAVSSALTDFVSDPTSDGIGVGLQVFPIPNKAAPAACTTDTQCGTFGPCFNRACLPFPAGGFHGCLSDNDCDYVDQHCVVYGLCANDDTLVCDPLTMRTCGAGLGACAIPPSFCLTAADCTASTYATAAAPIATLPAAKAGVLKVIQASTPVEGAQTPTGPALTGAIQEAKTWAMAHPDHQVVAVLATDGEPSLKASAAGACEVITLNSDIQAVEDLAATGLTADPKVSTFVIGVLSPDDSAAGAPAILNAIAKSGGTTSAFIVDTQGDVQMQFRDALNKIRASGLSCELAVPEPEAGKTLDYDQVNVSFDDGTGPKDLLGWPNISGCGAEGGWYYDSDQTKETKETPKRIIACPTTCTAFEKTDMGSVQIKLGCKTHTVVK
jgi:hypothetical protein